MTVKSKKLEMTTNDLAVERSRLAAERTLMAWVRTSLSMISFGFTIFKFFQYMKESGPAAVQTWEPAGARHMGSTLVILGTLILIPAVLQHWAFLRDLRAQVPFRMPISLALITAGFIALLGMTAMANLFFHFGPF